MAEKPVKIVLDLIRILAAGLVQLYLFLSHVIYLLFAPLGTIVLVNKYYHESAFGKIAAWLQASVTAVFGAAESGPGVRMEGAGWIFFSVFAGLLCFAWVIIGASMIVNIPMAIAKFHVNRASKFLFYEWGKTARYLAMVLLPVMYFFLVSVFRPQWFVADLVEAMIISNIGTTGVFFGLLAYRMAREKPEGLGYRVFNLLAVPLAGSISALIIVTSYVSIFIVEKSAAWLIVFHIFLLQAVCANISFYRANFDNIMEEYG